MLKGRLPEFSLAELLQSLAINHHTGTLTITAPGDGERYVYFEQGEISLFAYDKPQAPRIGEMLCRYGDLSEEQLGQALEDQAKSGEMLGKILVDRGFVSQETLAISLKNKLREEVYDLFLWEEGEFEFKIDEVPPELLDSLQKSVHITVNTNGVIMEGLRRLDEWNVVRSRLKTLDEIYARTDEEAKLTDEVHQEVLPLVDGKRNVHKICADFKGGVRLECCKALFEFLERRFIRPLTIEELRTGSEAAIAQRDYAQGVMFLRYAVQICPDEPQFFRELGDCLAKSNQNDEADKAYLQAVHLCFDQGNWQSAEQTAEQIGPNIELNQKDLQILFQTFSRRNAVKKARSVGTRLVSKLQEANEIKKAVEVLDALIRLDPKDYNLKLQAAKLLQKSGQTERATIYYEEVADGLEALRKFKEQIKILQLIAELNPERQDVKQKMAALGALQDRLGKRRKRRVTLVGALVITLLCCSLIPVVYEIKARELFSHAQRMEEIAMSTFDFRKARSSYEELLRKYKFSSRVDEARSALQRIDSLARSHDILKKQKEEERRQKEVENREILKKTYQSLREKAGEAESAGDFREAHRLWTEILAMGKQLPEARDVLLPLAVTSDPEGATVQVDQEQKGKTPVVLRYKPDSELIIKLSLTGCEDHEERVTLSTQYELHITLPRRPIKELLFSSNFEQPIHMTSGLIIFTSRNGTLQAFDPAENRSAWEIRVGRFGDRVSDLHVRDGTIYLVTVVGEVLAIDAQKGVKRWSANVTGPVFAAPSISEDSRHLAVSSLSGEVFILAAATGAFVGSFPTENEIPAKPVFAGEFVVAGSRDSYVYVYSLRKKALVFLRELSAPVTVDPVHYAGKVYLATADGRVHRLDPKRQEVITAIEQKEDTVHSLTVTDSTLLVALNSGKLLAVNPSTAKLEEEIPAGQGQPGGVAHSRGFVYVAYESGMLSAWSLAKKRPAWKWQASASLLTPPLISNKKLYLPCSSGALHVLEVIE